MQIGGQNWDFNRNELYAQPDDRALQGNRVEIIPPAPKDSIIQVQQLFSDGAIDGTKLGPIIDTGNAGITSIGDQDSDIRGWAGASFANRATAPFRYDKAGNVTATTIVIIGGTLKYGKTSFIDTTDAGYYFGVEGYFIGNAGDTKSMKYTIASGDYDMKGIKITALAVGSDLDGGYITNATITGAKIANATITSAQISGTAAITGAQIASATLTAANLVNNTITATQIANNTITAGQITNLTITAAQIANLTISSGKVQTGLMTYSHNIVFSVGSDTQVNWGTGTLTTSDGTAYTIAAGNTGAMAAQTYIYLDTAVSVTVLQITTTAANAVGDTKMLLATAKNNTTEAIFTVFNGIGGTNLAGSSIVAGSITASEIAANTITATQIAAGTITATQIAASTITASNISTLNMTGKSCTFDTGTIGGLTMGASTLSATVGGNTTIFSGGATAFAAGPTGSPSVTITQAGVLTATGAIINGQTFTSNPIFGDGSDGDVTISVDTNLSTDKFYNNLTVNSGITLNVVGHRIFCKTSCTANGKIMYSGSGGDNGNNGTPGASGGAGGVAVGDGGAGGNGSYDGNNGLPGGNGIAGGSKTACIGSLTSAAAVAGGHGGTSATNPGGNGGTAGAQGTGVGPFHSVRNLTNASILLDTGAASYTQYTTSAISGGSGGGGGGGGRGGQPRQGGGGGAAGGSGGAGGLLFLSAQTITIGAAGVIESKGGNGGNGGNGALGQLVTGYAGGGGGGGSGGNGGTGGVIILIYTKLNNSGSMSVAGGAGGALGTGAPAQTGADAAPDGYAGASGSTGVIYQLALS